VDISSSSSKKLLLLVGIGADEARTCGELRICGNAVALLVRWKASKGLLGRGKAGVVEGRGRAVGLVPNEPVENVVEALFSVR
jgi:hypothetical protein